MNKFEITLTDCKVYKVEGDYTKYNDGMIEVIEKIIDDNGTVKTHSVVASFQQGLVKSIITRVEGKDEDVVSKPSLNDLTGNITSRGKPLSEDKYSLDIENKVFSSDEHNLVLDFSGLNGWTFKTGQHCIFKTSGGCTFNTGNGCTFNTTTYCTFNTGFGCTFNTGRNCIFNTDNNCTFNTDHDCTFDTGQNCTFNTVSGCTFDTGSHCTFLLCDINTCKFKSYDDISIILDIRDGKSYKLTNTKESFYSCIPL